MIGGSGGDGARTLFTGTNDVVESFTTPNTGANFFTYSIPQSWPLDSLKAVIKGGGGGSGGIGDNSDGGWWAGNGGNGKELTVNVNTSQAALRVYVGGGGNKGVNRTGGQGSQTGFAVGGSGGNGTGGGGGGGGGAASAIGCLLYTSPSPRDS